MTPVRRVTLLFAAVLVLPATARAQVLGTFRWQLQPYCNVVTLVVTQIGGVYRVEGTDNQCGAATSASVVGTAFQNPDGSIGLGLNVVAAPGGMATPIDATIALANLNGSWRGPGGTSGSFVLTPGAPTAGSPRPLPAGAVPPEISLMPGGSIVARPEGDSGIPATGPGTRMMWYAGKAAFRSGSANNDQWDDPNVGYASTALGQNTVASGRSSLAAGSGARAVGYASTALGENTVASSQGSLAAGTAARAIGSSSAAIGYATTATGAASVALGEETLASYRASTALGFETHASGLASTAIGQGTTASGAMSFAGGLSSVASGDFSLAFGYSNNAGGHGSVALGNRAATTAAASGSFVFADQSTTSVFTSALPNEFGARFAGGYYLYTRADLGTGVAVAANGSSWAALSDANAKEHFRDVDGEDLLARLARVPIREWSYKAQDAAIRHMGPTAQDFRAAFGLGDFPLRINTIDADGVALAGVKALDARTRALQEENARLREATRAVHEENVALQKALTGLRQELEELKDGRKKP